MVAGEQGLRDERWLWGLVLKMADLMVDFLATDILLDNSLTIQNGSALHACDTWQWDAKNLYHPFLGTPKSVNTLG